MVIINNALNNITEAVDSVEYTTLIGATEKEVDLLLQQVNEILSKHEGA